MTVNKLLLITENERIRQGISIQTLSDKAEIGKHTYKKWMSGEYGPFLRTFVKALDVLGLELVLRRKRTDGKT